MGETLRPATPAQLREAVAWAAAAEARLEVVGGGSKRGLGRPIQASHSLDVSRLAGIGLYEPEELVLTAAAGTTMAEIEAALARHRQMLAFEPADWGPLLGAPAGKGTLGGAISANLAGPRRIQAGAARDHFLGFAAVSGRAEAFKAGGRVVKNVTGYDLCKLMAGSFGTLAVMTEVTVKVLPAPAKTRTVLVFGLDDEGAAAALGAALNSPCDGSGAAHLPAAIAGRSGVDHVRTSGASVTAVRVEGTAASVAARVAGLRALLGGRGALEELHTMNSGTLWRELGDVAPLLPDPDRAVWRICVPPSAGPACAAAIADGRAAEFYFDWGCGLVWLAVDPAGDGAAAAIRALVAAAGGQARLVRGPAGLRAAVPVFEPPPDPLATLTARVKDAFDPRRILNPGRMYAGL
ncbi:MAG: FAD-binding protein [Pseudomonadota bacterium]